jgi:hypothetical protein
VYHVSVEVSELKSNMGLEITFGSGGVDGASRSGFRRYSLLAGVMIHTGVAGSVEVNVGVEFSISTWFSMARAELHRKATSHLEHLL